MKFLKENFPILAAIAGPLAGLIAHLLNADEKVARDLGVLVTLVVVPAAISIRVYFDRDKDHNSLYAFLRGNLIPKKSEKLVGSKTEIVIIGHTDDLSTLDAFREEFQTLQQLDVVTFVCDSADEDLETGKLAAVLSKADGVILVRTKKLEKLKWLYTALSAWALQHSHLPCLVVDLRKHFRTKPSPLLEKFAVIPEEKGSLPSRLLKRANERSFAWRNQAGFNRMIALTLFILLATSVVVSYLIVRNQRRQDYRVLQIVYTVVAKHTKEDYQNSIMLGKDDTWNVSYWLVYKGTAYPLSSSEGGSHKSWGPGEPSIIGCAFAQPNRSVHWDKATDKPVILSVNSEPGNSNDQRCSYGRQDQRRLKSIVCASYSEDAENPVGVCLFTENENSLVSEQAIDFVKKRAKEFYEAVSPVIRDRAIVPVD